MSFLIQHFEADFLWKVSLKILNSVLVLKTFTHVLTGNWAMLFPSTLNSSIFVQFAKLAGTQVNLLYLKLKNKIILSSEINEYQKQIKVISITSEMIWYQSLVIDSSLYFHCSIFWITSDFSIHFMQLTSKVQTPITFLFVNKNIKCG